MLETPPVYPLEGYDHGYQPAMARRRPSRAGGSSANTDSYPCRGWDRSGGGGFSLHLLSGRDHYRRDDSVGSGPGGLHRRGEWLAEALLERPEQGTADRSIVRGLYAVADMPPAERLHGGHDDGEAVQALHHDRQGLHEHPALTPHVGLSEEGRQPGVELEQSGIEQVRCNVLDRLDRCPGGADQLLLGRG